MKPTLQLLTDSDFPALKRRALSTLQVNLGYLCNQSCLHCHVNAGPNRKELMSRQTIESVLAFLDRSEVRVLDLTGGAPEMNPHFRWLVTEAHARGIQVMDRCNLTILSEPGQEDLAEFLAHHRVEVVASLPCYLEENVDGQRGDGVFQSSIAGLRRLNGLGYGGPGLDLNLVYNPLGPYLPPAQCALEQDYRKHLGEEYGVAFTGLLTLANMPIQRFGSTLLSRGEFHDYMKLLKSSYRGENLAAVMCRDLISVDWRGYVYDCDFNQMLKLPLGGAPAGGIHLDQLDTKQLEGRGIRVADHCYGCTAGQGSSCGGALTP